MLSEAKNGFDAITQQLFAAGLPAVSTGDGDQLVGDVSGSMVGPTTELTGAFASVVSAGDQLDVASERLTTAKERLTAYPFDMADRMLASIRKRIASTYDYATVSTQSYGTARLDALQAEISAQVAELRTAMINGDGTAAARLGELKSQLAMLDLQSTIGSTISLIQDLSGILPRAESWSPDKDREAEIVVQLQAAIAPWRTLGQHYDELWQAGKERDEQTIVDVRRRVEALRKDSPLPDLIKQVASFQEDEAKHQRMIAIGVMIAAALLAAVTGGWASGAIGGLAGSIVGAGLEALTFTAITGTLETDQTFGGFMAELGVNFATFGGLRAISGTAKIIAGAEKLSLMGKAGELTVEGLFMVAATKANEEIQARLHSGEKMTTQSAATIFGHQMLIAFAGRVIARGGSALFAKLPKLAELDEVGRFNTRQLEAEKIARQFLTSGDDKAGAALVRADTEVLRAEAEARAKASAIAENPTLAEKYGIGAAERDELAAGARSAVARADRARDQSADGAYRDVRRSCDRRAGGVRRAARQAPRAGLDDRRNLDRQETRRPGSFRRPRTGRRQAVHLALAAGQRGRRRTRRKSLASSPRGAARLSGETCRRSDRRAGGPAQGPDPGRVRCVRWIAPSARSGHPPGLPLRAVRRRTGQERAEREAKRESDAAERNRKLREAHPDWPVVDDKPIRPMKATDSLY